MKDDEPRLKPACPLTPEGGRILVTAVHVCFQLGGLQHAPKGAQAEAQKLSDWIEAMEKLEKKDPVP